MASNATFSIMMDKIVVSVNKKSLWKSRGFFKYKSWRRLTLPRITAVPSALRVLTSLFGKGRGGHPRHSHHYNLRCVQPFAIHRPPKL